MALKIKFRGEVHTAETEEEYQDMVHRAKISAEVQNLVHPEDPWDFEELKEE